MLGHAAAMGRWQLVSQSYDREVVDGVVWMVHRELWEWSEWRLVQGRYFQLFRCCESERWAWIKTVRSRLGGA